MEEWAAKTYHSTARQAAEFAKKANAGRLIIGHFSNRYDNDESFLLEAREVFPATTAAMDGMKCMV
jgi:ribonuclease Z